MVLAGTGRGLLKSVFPARVWPDSSSSRLAQGAEIASIKNKQAPEEDFLFGGFVVSPLG